MLAEAEADLRPRLRPDTTLHGHHTRTEDFTAPNAPWRVDLVTAARVPPDAVRALNVPTRAVAVPTLVTVTALAHEMTTHSHE